MLVTEKQARQKWCPFARVDEDACNRHHVQAHRILDTGEQVSAHMDNNPIYARCIASECMMWRDAGDDPMKRQGSIDMRGYCGLAGKPA